MRIHPNVVLQALLAHDLMAFTEFAFGVVRPGLQFKPNWHLEAVTYKLSQVAKGIVGTIIKRKWLTTYDQIASRPDDRIVISWDIALSEIESGDYSACVVLLIRKEIVYILEVVRGRFPFEKRSWSSSGDIILPLF